MLSRRNFIMGGIAAIASAMTTCTVPPEPLPPAHDGEKLEDVLAAGIGMLERREYGKARAHFLAYKNKALVSTDRAQSMFSVQFLYAVSNMPDGTIFNGLYQAAGTELTGLLYNIKNAPEHLEWMQQDLAPFFALPDYPRSKEKCRTLRGRLQMFPFMIELLEQDYAGAKQALDKALPHLSTEEQHAVNFTLQVLADRAIKTNRFDKHAQYVALYSSIK